MSEPTRCACSFPHPPHDWCDGNPDGETLADVVKRRMSEPTIPPLTNAPRSTSEPIIVGLTAERDRLAERLRRAEELLRPLADDAAADGIVFVPVRSLHCRHVAAFLAESPTEKQA